MTGPDKIPEKKNENVLTCIHNTYTVSDTTETGTSEVDKIMIKAFLQTLAEIALSIAVREGKS